MPKVILIKNLSQKRQSSRTILILSRFLRRAKTTFVLILFWLYMKRLNRNFNRSNKSAEPQFCMWTNNHVSLPIKSIDFQANIHWVTKNTSTLLHTYVMNEYLIACSSRRVHGKKNVLQILHRFCSKFFCLTWSAGH